MIENQYYDLSVKLKGKKIYLNICQPIGHLELKQLTSLLKKYYIRNITIIVNEESILNYFKNFHKDFHLALDVDRIDEDVINICEHNNFDIIIPMDRFSKRTVDLLHKHNIKVGIREISNPIDASTVVNNNVDFFFTKELE